MNSFVSAVASVLEVEQLGIDEDFRSLPSWCSLHAFGLLVLMENDWIAPLTIDQLASMKTVRDLYREAFLAFAAKLLEVPRSALSGATQYGSLSQWDSVNHLRLCMEAERRFGVHYPLEMIPELKRLDDFLI